MGPRVAVWISLALLLPSLALLLPVNAAAAQTLDLQTDADEISDSLPDVFAAHNVELLEQADTGSFYLISGRGQSSHVTVTLRALPESADEVPRTQVVVATDSPVDQNLEAALLRAVVNELNRGE